MPLVRHLGADGEGEVCLRLDGAQPSLRRLLERLQLALAPRPAATLVTEAMAERGEADLGVG